MGDPVSTTNAPAQTSAEHPPEVFHAERLDRAELARLQREWEDARCRRLARANTLADATAAWLRTRDDDDRARVELAIEDYGQARDEFAACAAAFSRFVRSEDWRLDEDLRERAIERALDEAEEEGRRPQPRRWMR